MGVTCSDLRCRLVFWKDADVVQFGLSLVLRRRNCCCSLRLCDEMTCFNPSHWGLAPCWKQATFLLPLPVIDCVSIFEQWPGSDLSCCIILFSWPDLTATMEVAWDQGDYWIDNTTNTRPGSWVATPSSIETTFYGYAPRCMLMYIGRLWIRCERRSDRSCGEYMLLKTLLVIACYERFALELLIYSCK